jgi:predicted nucleic acid-binding protein
VSDIVCVDTSFVIGYLDNEKDRRQDAQEVLEYEYRAQSDIYTSILTLNEYLVKVSESYSNEKLQEKKIAERTAQIRAFALIYGISDDVAKESARLMAVWGRKKPPVNLPRDRKFRWDTLHLASANLLKANRVYCWDAEWEKFPSEEIRGIGQIICPARAPLSNRRPDSADKKACRTRKVLFD